mmetsp:Transcript_5681/g.9342  ORF Transcript_5681/g.9342 Transcript_5681/m.9342 type:complete len:712 (+) Transcript_5681:77-2212(+)
MNRSGRISSAHPSCAMGIWVLLCIYLSMTPVAVRGDVVSSLITSTKLDRDKVDLDMKYGAWFQLPEKFAAAKIVDTLEANAEVDSCFCDYDHVYWSPCNQDQIDNDCKNRISESYAWGMTRTADSVFWGTVANEQCLETSGNYESVSGIYCTDDTEQNWKIPSVYMYSVEFGTYRRISDDLVGTDYSRLNSTVGLRAAGVSNGVVVLGGFSRSLTSVFLFAFNSDTGKFLASREFPDSNDIRKFTADVNHDMYVGISRTDGTGDIWRFTGSVQNPMAFELMTNIPGNPAEISFYNEKLLVGTWSTSTTLQVFDTANTPFLMISPEPIDEMPSYETREKYLEQSSRIKAATRSDDGKGKNQLCWEKIWGIEQYEPDPVVQYSYGISAYIQVGDWLYWGTVQYPKITVALLKELYPDNSINRTEALRNSNRPLSLFRGRYMDTNQPEIELLYGEAFLPVYQNDSNTWVYQPNTMNEAHSTTTTKWTTPAAADTTAATATTRAGTGTGAGAGAGASTTTGLLSAISTQVDSALRRATAGTSIPVVPKFGRSGFGNIYNAYLWSINFISGYLVIGTFDQFGILQTDYLKPVPPLALGYQHPHMGADLYIMKISTTTTTDGGSSSSDSSVDDQQVVSAAQWITKNGYNNPYNWGFRNILVWNNATTTTATAGGGSYGEDVRKDNDGNNVLYIGTANAYNVVTGAGFHVYKVILRDA